jgi:hypothetical protein
MARVLVTTPSFGRFSADPHRAAQERGLQIVNPKLRHPLSADQLAEEFHRLDDIARVLAAGEPVNRVKA